MRVVNAQIRERIRARRTVWLMAFDLIAWAFGTVAFALLRVDFQIESATWPALLAIVAVGCVLQGVLGWVVRLYQGRARLASIEEMFLLGGVTATTGGLLFMANWLASPDSVPRSVPLGGTFLAMGVMFWGRAFWRRTEQASGRVMISDAVPALIFGAGDGGHQLVRSMLRDRTSTWAPVGLLDDDKWKQHLRIDGVPVLGTRRDMAAAAQHTGAETIVLAIPSASAELIRELSHLATEAGLHVKVLPGVQELMDHRAGTADVRDIDVADLLGRHQIETDLDSIAGYLTGKRVLVTGAGGSIGSELCRQIHRWGPEELIMLDRDESALHAVQLSIHGRALLDSNDVVLADIRDTVYITELFETRRPHVVFHAAALKHLPMLEQYPGEAVKTNVWGTLSVLEAARATGVEKFVNISTDKAANPANVLGYSKRLAEGLTAAVALDADGTYLSVRFGNVLGSRGSVLTAFAVQIAAGGPVTVTHPEVTRFFMTVQEAVQLVIQAAAIGRDGEALVLDMGRPVSIDDVARRLIEQSGRQIEIHYTGLRQGEKLHEALLGDGEPDERPAHPLVSHTPVPPLDPLTARELDPWAHSSEVTKCLEAVCDDLSMRRVRVTA